MKKRPCLWEQHQPDYGKTAEVLHPEKQTSALKTLILEKTKQVSSSLLEKTGDTVQQTSSTLPWYSSLPSTQTVMVSPLSRTEGQWSKPLPPEGSDWEAKVQRLAGLEKEAQRLRRFLGLEITKTTQGTMTTADSNDKQKGKLMTPPASTVTRAVGCQTDVAEVSRIYAQMF